MSDGLSLLDEEDVRRLVRLIESLDESDFDFLELKVGDLEVVLGKGDLPGSARGEAAVASVPPATAPPAAAVPAAVHGPGPSGAAAPDPQPSEGAAGGTEVPSPMMGVFYAQPEPGAAPFVTVGAEVSADTTVGLIEVMKTFAPVPAGLAGTVVEICVSDAQLVEFGQPLLRIEPAASTGR